ncbi:MAG: glycosyl hydrolase [Candidatus Eisenbacteria bacterium]|uniref:Glycosyl hydrolase n=1 Tax=Eiseniibacteriota bacterium TaxID=2212470 RepID=A0A849SHU8_UNCEI|nr:glycosyl hydrolase [Candidatus Eisenbacteria bacterium]
MLAATAQPPLALGASKAVAKLDPFDQRQLAGLEWRNIGPSRGGRATAATGVIGQRNVYYFGGTGGGIWKSTDSGVSWANVSDGHLGTGSVGAIAVSASDPNVIYAGMGEGCIRGNVSHGDGVYKSLDAGRSWKHVGLRDSRQIGRVRIHPRDPDLVYVAALGHTFGASHERGVFRTRDGGESWKCVLAVNDSTGAIDLVLDPRNPRVLYATTWQVHRTPWSLESGGSGSGLWKSTDGGDRWTRLTEGLPKGLWGRSGVAVSGANSDRVWAMVEAADGGLFRSDDAGRTWSRVNEDRNLRQRAWYYTHVYADPVSAEVAYVLNVRFMRSADGGKSFQSIGAPHSDHHDLWIDPDDPQRMIGANDGGVNVSFDGGRSWSSQGNQPTAQFYHVITDDGFPYKVYGAQQDNSTVAIPSRTSGYGIDRTDWYDVGGGESGFIAPKPGDPNIVYAGSYDGYLTRFDRRTGQLRDVNPYPNNPMGWGAEGAKYRFQWTFPIVISPHDPNVLYAGSNVLHRTTDEGHSWHVISPDLTRNDRSKLGPSGGPITKDNTSVEYYCTIFAMAESRRAPGLLWVGSDDGLVHVSRDAGRSWQNVTPQALPAWSLISQIEPSPHDPATAYIAANRYKLDDNRPYAFVTNDYGKSWRSIVGDLPSDAFVRVVREDPVRKHLLYCGTEAGVSASPDGGAHWLPLRLNRPGLIADLAKPDGEVRGALPVVPITDLVIKDNDVVVSTQGRSFWILDDIAPLRQLTPEVASANAWLFAPSNASMFGGPGGTGVGANPSYGATIYYRLAAEPKEKEQITLEFLDASGKLIRKFANRDSSEATTHKDGEGDDSTEPRIPARAGLNRFAWNLRYPDASRFKGMILWGGDLSGPTVMPGRYQVRLTVGGKSQTQAFEVQKDPRLSTTTADYQKRFDLHLKIRDKLTETHDAIVKLRDVRDQLEAVAARAGSAAPKDTTIGGSARALTARLTAVEEALYQTKNRSSQDPLNFPIRLNDKLSSLTGVVSGADAAPTEQCYTVYDEVAGAIDAELAKLGVLLGAELSAFNRLVREKELPAVTAKEKVVR